MALRSCLLAATLLLIACCMPAALAQACSNTAAGPRYLTSGTAVVHVSPCVASQALYTVRRCEKFSYLGIKTACTDGRCFRKLTTATGVTGWIRNANVATVPNAACATDPACANGTAAGARYVTTGTARLHFAPCAANPTSIALRRCEAVQFTGLKAWNRCLDGRCYVQVTWKRGGTGWILDSGVATIPAAACASDPGCVNTTPGQRVLTGASSLGVHPAPCACAASALATVGKCQAFWYTGKKQWNVCLDGLCLRQVRTAGGVDGWVPNSGIATLPSTACPCASVACNSPPACRSVPGTCTVVGGAAACSYPALLPAGTACEGTAGKKCSEAGVCKFPDTNPGCVSTAAGLRQLTGADSAPIYATPCATQPTGVTVRKCEAFQYTGTKAWNACDDGLCWRRVSTLGAGSTTGWVRESSGIEGMTAAACNPAPACTAFPDTPTNCPAPAAIDLSFFVIGDWGKEGGSNQTQVASLMGSQTQGRNPAFVLSTGDNFYPRGLSSTADPQFDASFKNVYTQAGLQGVPWHAVLGNHDYNDGKFCASYRLSPNHQLGAGPGILNARDARWNAYRNASLLLAGGQVEIFLIDTSLFYVPYKGEPWATYPGGILQQSWQQQYCSLKAKLAAFCAPWKLVVGHHPTRSNGKGHGNTAELITWLEPLFFRYGVQAMFAGHEHSLGVIKVAGPSARQQYFSVVSGAGSACQRGFSGTTGSLYQWPSSGFVSARVTRKQMTLQFHHLEAAGVAHTAVIPRVAS